MAASTSQGESGVMIGVSLGIQIHNRNPGCRLGWVGRAILSAWKVVAGVVAISKHSSTLLHLLLLLLELLLLLLLNSCLLLLKRRWRPHRHRLQLPSWDENRCLCAHGRHGRLSSRRGGRHGGRRCLALHLSCARDLLWLLWLCLGSVCLLCSALALLLVFGSLASFA